MQRRCERGIKAAYIEMCQNLGTRTSVPVNGGSNQWMHKHMLYGLHVVSTPLSDVLRTSSLRGRLRTGFLTMDQTRRLILLSESDPKAFDSPLVGV